LEEALIRLGNIFLSYIIIQDGNHNKKKKKQYEYYLFIFCKKFIITNKTRWKLHGRELIHGVKRIEKISHAPIYEKESSFVFMFYEKESSFVFMF